MGLGLVPAFHRCRQVGVICRCCSDDMKRFRTILVDKAVILCINKGRPFPRSTGDGREQAEFTAGQRGLRSCSDALLPTSGVTLGKL